MRRVMLSHKVSSALDSGWARDPTALSGLAAKIGESGVHADRDGMPAAAVRRIRDSYRDPWGMSSNGPAGQSESAAQGRMVRFLCWPVLRGRITACRP